MTKIGHKKKIAQFIHDEKPHGIIDHLSSLCSRSLSEFISVSFRFGIEREFKCSAASGSVRPLAAIDDSTGPNAQLPLLKDSDSEWQRTQREHSGE